MRFPRLVPFLFAIAAAVPLCPAFATAAPRATRALIVSVDGLRPDLIDRAIAPVMRGLMKRGSFTLSALTTERAVTLPSHVSMLTGVPPDVHGVTWNGDLRGGERRYSAKPTLFEVAHEAGFTTAMVTGKSKFLALDQPGTLDWSFVMRSGDREVTDRAVTLIGQHGPQVLFVHLPNVDKAGHLLGWGSGHQLGAVAGADRCIGRLLQALKTRGVLDSTVVLVTSDHGGNGRSHGSSVPNSRNIPWIVAGPGVLSDLDLATRNVQVATEDTFATVCGMLGITPPGPIEGRFVEEILSP